MLFQSSAWKTNITHHISELDKRLGTTPGLEPIPEQGSSRLGTTPGLEPIPEQGSSRFLLEGLFTNQVSSVTGLVAAGLSGLLISSLSSRFSRSFNQAQRTEERVFRGAEAEQHSWPWIARIKVWFFFFVILALKTLNTC